eukprot:scaffold189699_cov23-Prasinocladus_malaysianus.AAC.1
MQFSWSDTRLLVFANGTAYNWSWPTLEEWGMEYRYVSDSVDPRMGFGVIQLDHSPSEGEVMQKYLALKASGSKSGSVPHFSQTPRHTVTCDQYL